MTQRPVRVCTSLADHGMSSERWREVLELKAQPGGDLVLGGADLAGAFMRHDLIDEYSSMFTRSVITGNYGKDDVTVLPLANTTLDVPHTEARHRRSTPRPKTDRSRRCRSAAQAGSRRRPEAVTTVSRRRSQPKDRESHRGGHETP